jgi:hypothetical protein
VRAAQQVLLTAQQQALLLILTAHGSTHQLMQLSGDHAQLS